VLKYLLPSTTRTAVQENQSARQAGNMIVSIVIHWEALDGTTRRYQKPEKKLAKGEVSRGLAIPSSVPSVVLPIGGVFRK